MPDHDQHPPRMSGADITRQRIVEAACHLFAIRGYAETGVRDICTLAGVNQALVTRYFGSKLGLFETALRSFVDVSLFTTRDRESFGRELTDAFCASPAESAQVVPALIYAAGDSSAREVALNILKESVMTPLEAWFGGDEAADRAAQILILVTGFYTYRLMLPLAPLKGDASPGMREWLARALQEIVDRV